MGSAFYVHNGVWYFCNNPLETAHTCLNQADAVQCDATGHWQCYWMMTRIFSLYSSGCTSTLIDKKKWTRDQIKHHCIVINITGFVCKRDKGNGSLSSQGNRSTQHKQMKPAHSLRYILTVLLYRTDSASVVQSYCKMFLFILLSRVLVQKQTYCDETYQKVIRAANKCVYFDLLCLQSGLRFDSEEWIFLLSVSPDLFWSPTSLLPGNLSPE
jgi:hypothetical protein